MTAITLEDYIKPYREWQAKRHGKSTNKNDRRDTFISKILTFFYGVSGIGLAFLASNLGSLLVLGVTILSITGAPILATFGLGMMYKRANGIGMLCGTFFGFAFAAWITFGAYVNQGRLEEALGLYRVSFLMYGCYGAVATILIGIFGSEIVRIVVPSEREKIVDPILLARFLRPLGWKRNYSEKDNEKHDDKNSEDESMIEENMMSKNI
ncbi:putative sodium-dependent multivitamin transporter [Ptychodera flava]|uniref:putative sodium-dependent multivitamin transporter n=1 Tax=Ptychodera flava TaxID=63121 RepID=UPI003969F2CB